MKDFFKKYWLLILIAVIAIIAIIWYFVTKDDVPTPTDPVPPGSPTTTWKKESFPLNVGMYGPMIKALQQWIMKTYGNSALPKYGADGKFGTETKAALIAQGYSVPLSETDYKNIVPTSFLG